MTEPESGTDYVDSYEDVSKFHLDDDREAVLLSKQTECTFMWTTTAGEPVGVIMNFVFREGPVLDVGNGYPRWNVGQESPWRSPAEAPTSESARR